MDQQNDRQPSGRPRPVEQEPPAPRKRFRIEKVEERVAPKKGGGSIGSGGSETSLTGGSGNYSWVY